MSRVLVDSPVLSGVGIWSGFGGFDDVIDESFGHQVSAVLSGGYFAFAVELEDFDFVLGF